jgi:hypothetical protein
MAVPTVIKMVVVDVCKHIEALPLYRFMEQTFV